MTTPLVTTTHQQDVAIISLDQPATINALSFELCDELAAALDAANKSARTILLRSTGRGFCSGANLSSMSSLALQDGFDAGAILETHVNPIMRQIHDLDIPIVAAVRGPAAGAGASLALCCDIILVSDTAYFMQAFRKVGLVPDAGATFLLSRAIGRVRAMELMLLGEKLPAQKALDWGLVTRLLPDDALDEAAIAMAASIASGPAFALGRTRKLCWEAAEDGWETILQRERDEQRNAGFKPDFKEGIHAFLEKRVPKFESR
jgi:2-(1,2-epoxy-1,2-dihydrophenyl)acetyl-CoA isomerase